MALRRLSSGHRPDSFLLALIFILTIIGLVILSSASSDLGKTRFDNSYYYLIHQLLYGLLLGAIGFITTYFIDYRRYRNLALPFLLLSIIALTLVFTRFGPVIRETHRWVVIGPISFQPAELLKLTFIMYLSVWLSNTTMRRGSSIIEGYLPFLTVTGLVAALLLMQPATSTVVILISSGLIVYFASGAKVKYIFITALIGLVCLAGVILATPYRLARVKGYLAGGKDTQGANYHLNQALIAIGSGGLKGVGYGQSTAKLRNLPEPIDDSVFAILAEEFGFIGSSIVMALFAMLTFRLFWLARQTHDNFGKLMLIGFASVIALQTIVHISAISGLLPLTGVPLPLVSYGGTALAVFLTMLGVTVNISRHT